MQLKKQRGFLHDNGGHVLAAVVVCGLAGWACVEAVRWVIGHISFAWVS